jgi:site-specific DNA recombinase
MSSQRKKAVIYARVSTEEQASEGFSIKAQLSHLYKYAELSNFEVIHEYIDEGVSGKSIDGRPQIKKLLMDARLKKFDAVLVYKLDRISRKLKDALEISEELERNNIKLISMQENFDTTTPMGKMVFQLMSSFAELERNTIVDRVKMGMTERAKQGKWNGGQCLGYDCVNKQLVVNEQEAVIVKEIFDLAEQGFGLKAIVKRINEKGYKSKKGKLFSVNAIRTILENPIYIGKIRFNQVENWNERRRKGKKKEFIFVNGEHQPIITLEQWEKVQQLRKSRSIKPARSDKPYILSGLLKCPTCGHGMVPNRSKGAAGQSYRYYVCGQNHNKGSKACKAHSIRADKAEEYVLKELERIVNQPEVLKKIIEKANEQRLSSLEPLQQEIKLLESKIRKLSSKIDKLMDALIENELPPEVLKPKITTMYQEKEYLEQRLQSLKAKAASTDTKLIDFNSIKQLLSDFKALLLQVEPEQQKELLQMIIKDIQITKDAPRGVGRQITKINLYFDFTEEEMTESYKLLQKIYPQIENDIRLWSKIKVNYREVLRDTLESLNSLPLFMVRFPPIDFKCPVNLLEQNESH